MSLSFQYAVWEGKCAQSPVLLTRAVGCLKEKHLCESLSCWASCFLQGIPFLLERKANRQWWWGLIFGRHFLKINEVSLSLHKKQWTLFFAYDKTGAFKQQLEFWKTCIHHCEFDSFVPVHGTKVLKCLKIPGGQEWGAPFVMHNKPLQPYLNLR